MKTLRALYRIGRGPSSSHTMAPSRAAACFGRDHPKANAFCVTLYGALAASGRGHLTDQAMAEALAPRPVEFVWKPDDELPSHPNGFCLEALDASDAVLAAQEDYSIGGGALPSDAAVPDVYPLSSLTAILAQCRDNGQMLWEYVAQCEGNEIWAFLEDIWSQMSASIQTGLHTAGVIPGGLGLCRKARAFRRKSAVLKSDFRNEALLAAYAYAVAEQNACAECVVTAPTCGSSGVLPAVLYLLKDEIVCDMQEIVHALDSWPDRQPRQDQRFNLRRGCWLPGGDRDRLCHGSGCSGAIAGRIASAGRIRR